MGMLRCLPLAAMSVLLAALGGRSAIASSTEMWKYGIFSDASNQEFLLAQDTNAADLDTVEVEAPETLEIEQPGISLEEEAAIDSASVNTERCSNQLSTGRGAIDAAGIPIEGAAVYEPEGNENCDLSVTEKTRVEEAQAEQAEMDVSDW